MTKFDNLSVFGTSYQLKVLISLVSDTAFLNKVFTLLEPSFFEKEQYQWILEIIIRYYEQYKSSPSPQVMKMELDLIENDVLKQLIRDDIREMYTFLNSPDLDYVKDKFFEFCKNQKFKKAILDSADLIKSGDYDRIKVLIDDAVSSGNRSADIGFIFKDEASKSLDIQRDGIVTTGWDVVDDLMGGGLAQGELGVIIAPPGIGKSWGLIKLGLAAMKAGKTVLHYTLELSEKYVAKRYITCLLGEKEGDKEELVKKALNALSGDLIIKNYPTKTESCTTFKAHVNQLNAMGRKPDLIVVDYGDLVKPVGKSYGDSYSDLGNVFTELRGTAGELQVPVWTATQSGRDSIDEEIIRADKVSESFAKIMIADFIMSLSRKDTDKLANTGRWHIIKNRFGPDGMTFPSSIDYYKGKIDIFDKKSSNGILADKQSNAANELVKKDLLNKFKSMM